MRSAILVVFVAGCGGSDHESAPRLPPAAVPVASAPPAPPIPKAAKDDLAHLTAKLTPLLASAKDCLPRAAIPDEDMPLTFALDAFDGRLIICAHATTRRGVSTFFDEVSYACWNVDPKTAAMSRRADAGRAYFRCQDGSCAPYDDKRVISYEGDEVLAFDDAKHELAIATRKGDAIRAFPSPPDLAGTEPVRGTITFVGHEILIVTDRDVLVLDDHGKTTARIAGGVNVDVLDGGHVLIQAPVETGTLFDLATHKRRELTLPPFVAQSVRFGDAIYSLDDESHLLVRDPTTLRVRKQLALAICR